MVYTFVKFFLDKYANYFYNVYRPTGAISIYTYPFLRPAQTHFGSYEETLEDFKDPPKLVNIIYIGEGLWHPASASKDLEVLCNYLILPTRLIESKET